ncbi:MAG: hypothetical protein IKO62_10390 [Bacteroidales bacterium]|nr:hypothetical protein [Bacteroidales bacterium]MBR4537039.1 hypothetical protein [Bacteroidales bacterium]
MEPACAECSTSCPSACSTTPK